MIMRSWTTAALLLLTCAAGVAQSACWELGHNPFTGAPKTRRVEATSVLVDWVGAHARINSYTHYVLYKHYRRGNFLSSHKKTGLH